ncbi:UPF0280 family protein [Candidatus Margulisiibacteriota bacterium]
MKEEHKYRKLISAKGLVRSVIVEKETDILLLADRSLTQLAHKALKKTRTQLEDYIKKDAKFESSFAPHMVSPFSPRIIKKMAKAAKKTNVGPMAAVAGAVAEEVGLDLMKYSGEVIVENGGDIFIKLKKPRRIGIYAGKSPFSEKIAIEIKPEDTPLGVCTSSGTVGHSTSFGSADAVVVTSKSTALADAAATAIANVVKDIKTIEDGLDLAKKIKGLHGVLIIKGNHIGAFGNLEIVPI